MTLFCGRTAITASIMALMVMIPMLGSGQTTRQQQTYSQEDYYRWYYQQYQQYQQYYHQQRQNPGAWHQQSAYRGYQANQPVQQAAPWSGAPAATAYPAQPRPTQAPARPVRRDLDAADPVAAKTKVSETPAPKPAPAASRAQVSSDSALETSSNAGWLTSFDAACKRAQEEGKPIVVLFVHHGCPECDRMDQNLAKPGAKETLACAIKVRIEFTENPAVVSQFGVTLTPTFLVLSPTGTEAYRQVGALDVDRLRQIQPALESLVAGPATADVAEASS